MPHEQERRWQRRKEVRPAEIIDAALTLFVDKGYSATKIDDIARAAGVTKGTPYLYFGGKEDLLKAVVRDKLVDRLADLEALSRDYPGSRRALLSELLTRWWDEVGSTPLSGLCKLMVAEAGNFPELARFYHDEVIVRSRALALRALREGVASGEFRALPDEEAAIDALLSPLLMAMIWRHSFARVAGCVVPQDAKNRLETTLALVLAGLQAATIPTEGGNQT